MQELELAKNSAPAAAQKGSIPQGSVTMELKMLIDSVFIIYKLEINSRTNIPPPPLPGTER